MKMGDDPRLLFEVARLFYEKDWSKSEIANKIGVSNTQVARLLKEAHERKIVQVKFSPPQLESLGAELVRHFGLRRAIVVPSVGDSEYESQRRMWGEAAADYFEENVKDGMKVGVSGGNTIYEMIAALPDRERLIQIYPTAIIGRGPTINHLDPLVLVTLLWAKSGRRPGTAHYVTVPPFERDDTPELVRRKNKELLKRNEKVAKVYGGLTDLDIMFGSLGSVEVDEGYRQHSHLTTISLLEEIGVTKTQLARSGAVGDINYSFFDEGGKTRRPDWEFFLTLDAGAIRRMASDPKKEVVVIAGSYKIGPLRAALRGELCNVLITDERTARTLLSNDT